MEESKINGCETKTYSRMASRCRACPYKEYCSQKRIEAEAATVAKVEEQQKQIEEASRTLGEAAAKAGMSLEEFSQAFWGSMSRQERRRATIEE